MTSLLGRTLERGDGKYLIPPHGTIEIPAADAACFSEDVRRGEVRVTRL